MASTYPHYPYFWAAYGITAVIYLVYAISLLRRRARTALDDARPGVVHQHDHSR